MARLDTTSGARAPADRPAERANESVTNPRRHHIVSRSPVTRPGSSRQIRDIRQTAPLIGLMTRNSAVARAGTSRPACSYPACRRRRRMWWRMCEITRADGVVSLCVREYEANSHLRAGVSPGSIGFLWLLGRQVL